MLRAAQVLLAAQVAFTPVLRQFSTGSGSDVAPLGATNVLIELMGPGGGGNWVNGVGNTNFAGGGGGAYCRLSIAVLGGDVINWNAGTFGAGATVVNTSAAAGTNCTATGAVTGGAIAMTARVGAPALAGATTGSPGAGGTASGGTVNTSGGAGTLGQPVAGKGGDSANPSGGTTHITQGSGGFNDTVSNPLNNPGSPPGGGGGGYQSGATPASHGGDGANGIVSLFYT